MHPPEILANRRQRCDAVGRLFVPPTRLPDCLAEPDTRMPLEPGQNCSMLESRKLVSRNARCTNSEDVKVTG